MKMKKVFVSWVLAVVFLSVSALTAAAAEKMVIHFKNGRTETVNLEEVKQIEFSGTGGGTASFGLSGRTVEIVAKHSNKCLDVAGVSTGDGANVQQWQCHGGDNQKWLLTDKGGGYYEIRARHSGKCLDIAAVSTATGANAQQWTCHGGDNQLWMVIPQGGGYHLITAKHSGKCLDVSGVSTGDGANVYQWDCHGGDNQLWRLR
ncbi:MAG TPA: RICIN domain-containing protein [Syntrophales bacterium]|mgnify:CR=1 FL=1|nr:RICIN domain-containing protein [Syntrophales bacterium]HOM06601.1 RICIN domain-containing protein [Syntrophales bacterium]HON99616.1 RICIN domain-containing protein [Syntrophales bacterium]HPQ06137.1 RICIN domain-containing protein [Syntrophales bacterium]HRV42403.1 RICIN domain-containing protein [Syntrophales bacterium]